MPTLEELEDLDVWDWPPGADDAVVDGLRSADAAERLRAAGVAGLLYEDERVVVALTDLVAADPDPAVRARAAVALGPTLEDCDGGLGGVLGGSPVSREAFERACDVLEAVFADEANPKEVRRRVLEGAVRAPRPWQEAAIRAACADRDPEWRTTGVFAAAWYPLDALAVAALDDADDDVRAEAVQAMGTLGARGQLDRVLAVASAKDTPRIVRLAAIGALAELGSDAAERVLAALARSDDEEIAEAAADALSEVEFALGFDDDDLGFEE